MINPNHLEGMIAFDKQEYEKAKELFLKAIASDPDHLESYFFAGQSCFLCEERTAAIDLLQTYIKRKKQILIEIDNVPLAFIALAQCYDEQGNGAQAVLCSMAANKFHSPCPANYHTMGLLFLKFAENYLEQNPNYSTKLFEGAKFYLHQALKLCSDSPAILHSIGGWHEKFTSLLIIKQNDPAKITNCFRSAIDYYQQAIAKCRGEDLILRNIIIENLTECLAQYGHHLYQNGEYQRAQELYTRVIKLDATHFNAITQLGMCYLKRNFFAEARAHFSSILALTTNAQEMSDVWLNNACTYRMEKNFEMAEIELDRAGRFAPADDKYILAEKEALMEAKSQAVLVNSSQTLFGSTNVVPQAAEITAQASSQFTL